MSYAFRRCCDSPASDKHKHIYGCKNRIPNMTDDIEEAVETANKWADHAAPIIKEYVALDHMDARLQSAAYAARNGAGRDTIESRPFIEAASLVGKTRDNLETIIKSLREEAISDVYFYESNDDTDEEEDAKIAANAAVRSRVTSVDDAIKAHEGQ